MKTRLTAIAAVTAALLGGLFVGSAAAASSTVTAVVDVTAAVYPGSASDTATVTGDVNSTPGGTLTYTFYTGSGCTGTGSSAGTVPVTSGSAASSDTETSLGAGSYSFDATYNGDGTNDPSGPTCESFTIGPATPTVTISNLPTSGGVGGSFTAVVTTDGDGSAFSVTSTSLSVCSVSGFVVTYVGLGSCALTAGVAAGTNYAAASDPQTSFSIGPATPTVTISNLPTSGTFGGSFTADVTTNGDGTVFSVTSTSPTVCTVSGLVVSYVHVGSCALTAGVSAGTNYAAASDPQTPFTIGPATPTVTISNLPTSGTFGGSFTAVVTTNGDGTTFSIASTSPTVCTVSDLVVSYVHVGSCALTANVTAGTNYAAATGSAQTIPVAPKTPTTITITNLPRSGTYGGGFTATVNTDGDGVRSVTSSSPTVCTASGLTVSYVGVGTCSLNAQVAAGTNYTAGSGGAQTFNIGRAAATTPVISNIPLPANEFAGFTVSLTTTGDGTMSVTSNTSNVCSVDPNGITVTFVGFGTCSLTPSVAQGPNHFGATGNPQAFTVNAASHGYWLVGSDGGIFSFGTAAFFGSTGSIRLQRPVVGITPTSTRNGYWLVASDGGIFSFGDSSFYGSIPGLGLHPAGSRLPNSLNAPIVGMVPTLTGRGYFMVASDGGVFSFGDARFEGSCPGIGGCSGPAVTVIPDHSGNGYWVVTADGGVYAFGDAPFYGSGPPVAVPVVDAVATPNGNGYWLLYANGAVAAFGAATALGGPIGYVNSFNPAAAIFRTADGFGYWVAAARGDVFGYGSAPYLGGMAAAGLNGQIIAAFGF